MNIQQFVVLYETLAEMLADVSTALDIAEDTEDEPNAQSEQQGESEPERDTEEEPDVPESDEPEVSAPSPARPFLSPNRRKHRILSILTEARRPLSAAEILSELGETRKDAAALRATLAVMKKGGHILHDPAKAEYRMRPSS